MKYKTVRTTMGRKYKVQMSEAESAERFLYNVALVFVPFISAAGMFLLWVKMG
jgi:hypothetical protein